MNSFKELLGHMFRRYCIVFALVCSFNVIMKLLFYKEMDGLSTDILLGIEAIAVLCALGEIIIYTSCEVSKNQMLIRKIAHYIYINLVVIGVASGLQKISLSSLLILLLVIAIIYWINCISEFQTEKKEVEKLNSNLQRLNHSEEKE